MESTVYLQDIVSPQIQEKGAFYLTKDYWLKGHKLYGLVVSLWKKHNHDMLKPDCKILLIKNGKSKVTVHVMDTFEGDRKPNDCTIKLTELNKFVKCISSDICAEYKRLLSEDNTGKEE